MPLTIRVQTIGLEELDSVPYFQNVVLFSQPLPTIQPVMNIPEPIVSPFITPTLTLS